MNPLKVILILILFAGAFQGIVFGSILLKSKNNRIANRILAILLFLLSYRLSVQIMRLFGLGYYDTWYYFMLDLSWITGALLYFYTKAQTNIKFRISKKDYIHFIPLFIQISISIFVRLQNLYWNGTKESLSWLGYWGYVVWMNYSTIYIIASILIIYYSFKSLKVLQENSSLTIKKLQWIKRIIRSFQIYFSLVLVVLLVDLLIYNLVLQNNYFYFIRFYYYPFFIGISLLTYWIGMEGFSRKDEKKVSPKNTLSEEEKLKLATVANQLKSLMEEKKLYKTPKLNLTTIARELNTKPYLISQCLSEILGKNFNDFINEYRVQEVQHLLSDPKNSKFTLLSLALEAGFNSKSSFNRAVQKHLGVSPNQLKKNFNKGFK